VKTAISIPDAVFRSAEQLASRMRVSRSELYAKAVAAYVAEHRDELVTSRLNELYGTGKEGSALDPALAAAQTSSLGRDRW